MMNPIMNVENDLLSLFQYFRGREYVGNRFDSSPRPERFKNYSGPYVRLKTSTFKGDLAPPPPLTGTGVLERILLPSFGVTSVKFYGHQSEMLWSFPSAGGCYPVETYVIVRSLSGVAPGIYYYSSLHTSLYKIGHEDQLDQLNDTLLPQDREADFYFVLTAIPWRSCWKYSYKGYRFSLIDTGHVMTNFQLVIRSLGMTHTAYTTLQSRKLKSLLRLDANEEAVALIAVKESISSQIDSASEHAGSTIGAAHGEPPEGAAQSAGIAVQPGAAATGASFPQIGLPAGVADHALSLRSATSEQPDANPFDWSPVAAFQKKVSATVSEPSAAWLAKHELPAEWNDYAKVLQLIIDRRSSSCYLPEELAYADFMQMVEFIRSLQFPLSSVYFSVHAVEDLVPGVYVYDSELRLIKSGDFRAASTRLCLDQEFVFESSVVFFFAVDASQVSEDNYYVYQQRLVDAGILGQMVYLKAQELGLGYSAIGGYYDFEVNETLQLPPHLHIVYAGTLGKDDPASVSKVKKDRYIINRPKENGAEASC
ncbi:SagB family peptide dehydrogenase [Paenibacillus athensensis]|uniref:Nitroreductase domain-containing protein n=1 Tax=Paenibacillus athensensis TaxID=1967502 RepID=A0A4Y8PWG5_9BACL|nr:SagB family peptide dehydrogenase [Paenibacillus athensensis]MCD1260585.1 SagB family peptide dehydrogenase [Paenibacillus athensensis]